MADIQRILGRINDYKVYKKALNAETNEVRKSKRNFEYNLAHNIKSDSKSIIFNSIQFKIVYFQHNTCTYTTMFFCTRRVEKGASRRQRLCGLVPNHNIIDLYTITYWRQ